MKKWNKGRLLGQRNVYGSWFIQKEKNYYSIKVVKTHRIKVHGKKKTSVWGYNIYGYKNGILVESKFARNQNLVSLRIRAMKNRMV